MSLRRQRWWTATLVATMAGTTAGLTLGVVAAGSDVAHAEPAVLQIVAQDLTVASDGTLTMTVRLPAMDEATAAEADVVVTAYRRVDSRLGVRAAIAGMLPQALDAVDTPVSGALPAGPGEVTLTMPIETDVRTPEGLQLSNPGLYPVVVDVRAGGDPLASVVTFVDRLEVTPPEPYATLPVSLAMSVRTPITIDTAGTVVFDDGDLAQYTALVGALEASAMPATVHLPHHRAARSRSGARRTPRRPTRARRGGHLAGSAARPLVSGSGGPRRAVRLVAGGR
jgi:hypothetical protein